MSNTSMIRINNKLKERLKDKARAEGRTLEWMANDAISAYILLDLTDVINGGSEGTYPQDVKFKEPKRIDTQDWGA